MTLHPVPRDGLAVDNEIVIRGVRPYGVSLLVSGWDKVRGPTLYQVDPSGSYWAWKASAIGKNMANAKTFLEKRCVAQYGSLSPRSRLVFQL